MSKRWTAKQLNETDDLTFAMCVLSERRELLNQESPLAKKLQRVYRVLEELRDMCREHQHYAEGMLSTQDAIYKAAERMNIMADIESCLIDSDHINVFGLTPAQIMADKEIIGHILHQYFNNDDYWCWIKATIEHGIKDVVEERRNSKECTV